MRQGAIDAFALLGPFCVLAAVLAGGLRLAGASRRWRWVALPIAAIVATIPVSGLFVAGYVRAYLGDLSVTSLALLVDALLGLVGLRRPIDRPSRRALPIGAAVLGIVLYPFALAPLPYDPYVLGFKPIALPIVLAGLVLWSRQAGRPGAAVVVMLAILAYHAGVLEAANLWDYLLDPWLVLVGWLVIARYVGNRRRPGPRRAGGT